MDIIVTQVYCRKAEFHPTHPLSSTMHGQVRYSGTFQDKKQKFPKIGTQ